VPIRVGANSGSLPKDAHGNDLGEALAKAVLAECRAFEAVGFTDLVLSAKGSDCASTVAAGRVLARETEHPIHVGVTAAGPENLARAKSAIGIGSLLLDGIGDTIRVSYTGEPHAEVAAAYDILDAIGLGRGGPEVISCPTCGRTRVDLLRAVEAVQRSLAGIDAPIRIAVMGCEVNGPGEARDADVGLACAKNGGYLFAKGQRLRRVDEDEMVGALLEEAKRVASTDGRGA
jgi:(E)-4-hydroxy-3-methylbut-2-enyl-diphosphate synthase